MDNANKYNLSLKAEGIAPIERAFLLQGFKAKKTPLKWIKFFRLCVLQKEKALRKNNALRIVSGSILGAIGLGLTYYFDFNVFILIGFGILGLIIDWQLRKRFRNKYKDGYEFFSEYFSALFTLIEEELTAVGTIKLEANLKDTISKDYLQEQREYPSNAARFISGKEYYYEKPISVGTFEFKDATLVHFRLMEKTRSRKITKRGSVSGKRKQKIKYKSVYPFIIQMRIPKSVYQLRTNIDREEIDLEEDDQFYLVRAKRKFNIKEERPEDYNYSLANSIKLFPVDYFTMEVVNLFNQGFGLFQPK